MALLALDYAYGGQFERATVVSMLTVALVVVAALLAVPLTARIGLAGHRAEAVAPGPPPASQA